jgi:hypothetical protein
MFKNNFQFMIYILSNIRLNELDTNFSQFFYNLEFIYVQKFRVVFLLEHLILKLIIFYYYLFIL